MSDPLERAERILAAIAYATCDDEHMHDAATSTFEPCPLPPIALHVAGLCPTCFQIAVANVMAIVQEPKEFTGERHEQAVVLILDESSPPPEITNRCILMTYVGCDQCPQNQIGAR